MPSFIDDLEKSTQSLSANLKNYFEAKDLKDKENSFKSKISALRSKPVQVGTNYENVSPMVDVGTPTNNNLGTIENQQSSGVISSLPSVTYRDLIPEAKKSIVDIGNISNDVLNKYVGPRNPTKRFGNEVQIENDVPQLPVSDELPNSFLVPRQQMSVRTNPVVSKPSEHEILRQLVSDPEMVDNPYLTQHLGVQKVLASLGDEDLNRQAKLAEIKHSEAQTDALTSPKPVKQWYMKQDGTWEYGLEPTEGSTPLSYATSEARIAAMNPDWKPAISKDGQPEYYDVKGNKFTGVRVPTQGGMESAGSANLPPISPTIIGDDYLAEITKVDPELPLIIKKMANYEINPNSYPTRLYRNGKLLTQQDIIKMTAHYDPSYDVTTFPAKQKFRNDWYGGAGNRRRTALSTVTRHIKEIKATGDDIDKLLVDAQKGGWFTKQYNTLGTWLADNSGKPEVIAFETAAGRVADELAVLYKGGNASATDVGQEKERILNQIKNSPASKGAYLGTTLRLLSGVIASMRDNYESNMGKPAPKNDIITPRTRKALKELKNSGVDFDMEEIDPIDEVKQVDETPKTEKSKTKVQSSEPDQVSAQRPSSGPKVGDVETDDDGLKWEYRGGNPDDQSSWKEVK